MTWEAFRLTSKSPGDLYRVLGPHAVDELMRHAMNSCWRQVPEEERTFEAVLQRVEEIFARNFKVWRAIKKPTPQAYFADLDPNEADGLFRQAFVLSWMMLPRKGGRKFADTHAVIEHLYQRNLDAWREDNRLFTEGPKTTGKARAKAKVRAKPKVKAKPGGKGAKSARRPVSPGRTGRG